MMLCVIHTLHSIIADLSILQLRNTLRPKKILREAPRDSDRLRKLIKAKQRELEAAIKIEDAERVFPEIEMLRFVLCAVS